MNLNQNPSVDQLKQLFASVDDEAGHHILWVDLSGNVHLSIIPEGLSPVGFQEELKTSNAMKFCLDTFPRGSEDVGVDASKSDEHMDRIFGRVMKAWSQNPKPGSYIDQSEL